MQQVAFAMEQDPLRSADLQAARARPRAHCATAREKSADDAIVEGIGSLQLIAHDGADLLIAQTRVIRSGVVSILKDVRLHPARAPKEKAEQIERVCAQHHQVLAAAAVILLAVAVDLP